MPRFTAAAMGAGWHPQSALDPASPQAQAIALLWWTMLAVAVVVFAGVMVVLALGAWRARHRGEHELGRVASRNLVIAGGVAIPLVVLIVLVAGSVQVGSAYTGDPAGRARLTVEVTGWRWWWEVRYLDAQGRALAVTANEIHVPVDVPVRFLLRSGDVIHSFWVPNLQGKTDMIPGSVTQSWFEARRAGVYRGQCAEYCGTQHAHMAFEVVAEPVPRFEQWLARQAQPAAVPQQPQAARGREVFARACANCHQVREPGESIAPEGIGPDLTHVAGRRMLAAATLPNTHGHLAGWIADPQAPKPGALMPPVPLAPEELHAVVRYLDTLE